MSFGFYMTDAGIEKVAKATARGEKVKINTLAVGDGGDPTAEWNYERTALENETYRKQMDDMDSYEINRNNPNVVTIIAVVPDETGAITVNEVGFLDEEGDLIVYGLVEETSKGKGSNGSMQTIEITCHIDFVNTGAENVEISVGSDGLIRLQGRVDALEVRMDACETEEASIREELKKFVLKEAGKGLSSKDFTQNHIDQITENAKSITDLAKLLSEKADRIDLNNYVQKVAGKNLSTNDFTNSYKNQIDTNKTDISSLKNRVSSLESSSGSSASSSDLSRLEKRVSSLETQLSGLATRLSSVATSLEELR